MLSLRFECFIYGRVLKHLWQVVLVPYNLIVRVLLRQRYSRARIMFMCRHPGETKPTKSFNTIKLKELNITSSKLFHTGLLVSPFRPVYSVTFISQRMQKLNISRKLEVSAYCEHRNKTVFKKQMSLNECCARTETRDEPVLQWGMCWPCAYTNLLE